MSRALPGTFFLAAAFAPAGIPMRRTLALLLGLSLLVTAVPTALAAGAHEGESISCNPTGYVGKVLCTTIGLACILITFLFGPAICSG